MVYPWLAGTLTHDIFLGIIINGFLTNEAYFRSITRFLLFQWHCVNIVTRDTEFLSYMFKIEKTTVHKSEILKYYVLFNGKRSRTLILVLSQKQMFSWETNQSIDWSLEWHQWARSETELLVNHKILFKMYCIWHNYSFYLKENNICNDIYM